MMVLTQAQQTQLEQAIERATEHNIEVVAHGRRKVDGARLLFTTSHSDPQRWHAVVVGKKRLVCDCPAGKYGKICVHRAAAYMHLVVQASLRDLEARDLRRRMEAPPPPPATCENPRLAPSTAAIGIYKH